MKIYPWKEKPSGAKTIPRCLRRTGWSVLALAFASCGGDLTAKSLEAHLEEAVALVNGAAGFDLLVTDGAPVYAYVAALRDDTTGYTTLSKGDRVIYVDRKSSGDYVTLVLIHEIGHALGLRHVPPTDDIMNEVAPPHESLSVAAQQLIADCHAQGACWTKLSVRPGARGDPGCVWPLSCAEE